MACLKVQLNNDQQQGGLLGPRISFSNDFGEANMKLNSNTTTTYREAPVSSDFEFSVPCFASNSADELFFRSTKILPLKEKVVTLRDELLANDDEDDDDGIFLPKSSNSGWWRFGRSQTHSQGQNQSGLALGAKKGDHKNHGGLETIDEANHYHRK